MKTTMHTRRRLLATVAGTLAAALARDTTYARAEEIAPEKAPAAADALIVLWMNGGPSHIDTFDPKHGTDAGPFASIATKTPGLVVSEHLPRLAEQSDKLVVVRSMTSNEGNHERARYLSHTGYAPTPTVVHPALGSWVSSSASRSANLPSFVSIDGPAAGAGFLGPEHAPLIVRKAGEPPQNVRMGHGVDPARFDRRLSALDLLERGFAARTGGKLVEGRRGVYERAVRMVRAPELVAFDLDTEPARVREAYGDSDFGRGCLLARRLVEAGVRVVEVSLDGWDTHEDGFDRSRALMGQLDPAMSALLTELAERDRLRSTLVVCMGEFGRSPGINGREGRDHHPRAASVVLAGGGLRRGIVYGATDERGERVVEGPVKIADLHATLAVQLGLEPDDVGYSAGGRPIAMTDRGVPIAAIVGV